jgi:hypothetical protein
MQHTSLRFLTDDRGAERSVPAESLIIAGWTGRDPVAMEAHIVELEKLGVARPKSTPIFYRGTASLLTQADEIQVLGNASSGEVEPVILGTDEGLFIGVGSDHTDRKVETIGVSISKQLCAKPISRTVWRFDEVSAHWDELIVRSWATRDGKRQLYQQGALARMRHPSDLLRLYGGERFSLPAGTVMFCGTVAAQGEIAPAEIFDIEIEDPVLDRRITHSYRTIELPIAG